MRSNLWCGSEWIWGGLVVICVFLQMSSALEQQTTLEKRIFCNFEGCHNKRSDTVRSRESLVARLFPSKLRSASTDNTIGRASQRDVTDDTFQGGKWGDMDSSAGSDDIMFEPELLRAIIRGILTNQRLRRHTGY